ncbi:MAG TPA: TerB family tellurite resistance protein [Rubricoccaceae bacterium]|nr:TerB family tellurite resistance protein [Rubricoccaceae bacterium]
MLTDAPLALRTEHLRDLALLYYAVAYQTDRWLSSGEEVAVHRILRAWSAGRTPDEIDRNVQAALWAARAAGPSPVEAVVDRLKRALPPGLGRRVLADLARVAQADGFCSAAEATVIARIRAAWG